MKNWVILGKILLGAAVLLVSFTTTARALHMSKTKLIILPEKVSVKAGEEFSVTVEVQEVTRLVALGFDLIFDGKRLKLIRAEPAKFLGEIAGNPEHAKPGQVIFTKSIVPQCLVHLTELSCLIISQSRFMGKGSVTGSGTIIKLTFKAKAPGAARLEFGGADLFDIENALTRGIPDSVPGKVRGSTIIIQ